MLSERIAGVLRKFRGSEPVASIPPVVTTVDESRLIFCPRPEQPREHRFKIVQPVVNLPPHTTILQTSSRCRVVVTTEPCHK